MRAITAATATMVHGRRFEGGWIGEAGETGSEGGTSGMGATSATAFHSKVADKANPLAREGVV